MSAETGELTPNVSPDVGIDEDAAPDEDSDEALMLRYRDGDAAAFERLYGRHKGPLYRYLLRRCARRDVAEELFQDVWTNVIRARTRYRVEARFTTWLYRIAHNRAVDHHRRGRDADGAFDTDEPISYHDDPADVAVRDEAAARVHAALAALPPEQREAFLLHEEGGLDLDEIAKVTGAGRETAKSRLRYAVAKLKRAFDGAGGER